MDRRAKQLVTVDLTVIRRWQAIEEAATALIARIDWNLGNRRWPVKYAVPWKEAKNLRDLLGSPTKLVPLDDSPIGRIPPGPRHGS